MNIHITGNIHTANFSSMPRNHPFSIIISSTDGRIFLA